MSTYLANTLAGQAEFCRAHTVLSVLSKCFARLALSKVYVKICCAIGDNIKLHPELAAWNVVKQRQSVLTLSAAAWRDRGADGVCGHGSLSHLVPARKQRVARRRRLSRDSRCATTRRHYVCRYKQMQVLVSPRVIQSLL